MELWRRWILVLGLCVGLFLVMTASLRPLITVQPVDFAKRQEQEGAWSEKARYLGQLPLEKYIAEVTKGRLTPVEGPEWTRFFDRVFAAASAVDPPPADWSYRLSADELGRYSDFKHVFFHPSELREELVPGEAPGQEDNTRYLSLGQNDKTRYLAASPVTFSHDDFQFGSGLARRPTPPSRFLYPWRRTGVLVALASILLYLFLPYKKPTQGTIYYSRWRVIAGDLVGLLLFVPFFVLPMFVIGGAVQALTVAWPLTVVVWPLAFVGIWLTIVMARYAAYRILVRDNGIELATYRGISFYPFADMRYSQPLRLKPPGWLVALLALAAIFSKGASRYRLAGQSMILGTARSGGIALALCDGSSLYLWITDQMGSQAMKNVDGLNEALSKSGVRREDEVKTIQSILMPDGEPAPGTRRRDPMAILLVGLLISPFVAIALMVAGASVYDTAGKVVPAGVTNTASGSVPAGPPDLFADARPLWTSAFRAGVSEILRPALPVDQLDETFNTFGTGLLVLPSGRMIVYGYGGPPTHIDAFAFSVDTDGQRRWQHYYGFEASNEMLSAGLVTKDGGCLLMGDSGHLSAIQGGSQAYLVRIAESGEPKWSLRWGNGAEFPEPCTALEYPDGSLTVVGTLGEPALSVFSLHIDSTGKLIGETVHSLASDIGDGKIHWVAAEPDGSLILTGEIAKTGETFKDLMLMRLTPNGKVAWQTHHGREKREFGQRVVRMADGGYLAAGLVDTLDEQHQLYAVRVDKLGGRLWEQTVQDPGKFALASLEWRNDGQVVIWSQWKAEPNAPAFLKTIQLDKEGAAKELWRVTSGSARCSIADVVQAGDRSVVLLANRSWGFADHSDTCLLKLRVE